MSEQKIVVKEGGIGFCGLLGIVFIVLKLAGVISWSWLWVLCPFWGPFAILAIVFLFIGIVWGMLKSIDTITTHRKQHKNYKRILHGRD